MATWLEAARARPAAALWVLTAAVVAARLALLALNRTELFVDEAQYWHWSTDLELGYFSKPPLIAWTIRAFTELGGDASTFWIRAPAPILHGAAALLVGAIGARVYGPWVGFLSGAAWLTVPGATLGSQVISTDTLMLPFLAGAILLWLRLTEHASMRDAFLMGLCLGLGFLAKYAAAYLIPCAALMALLRPGLRIAWRDAALAAFVFLDLAALNVGWNLANGAVTFEHVAQDAGSASRFPDVQAFLAFFGAQFGVLGPVLFAAFLIAAARRPESDGAAALRWLSIPILAVVGAQALRAGANANWAAASFVATVPVAAAWLAPRPKLTAVSFWITGAVAVALPLAATAPDLMRVPGGPALFKRVSGQQALVDEVRRLAAETGAAEALASHRAVLSALVYGFRNDPAFAVRAPRPSGPPQDSFQMLLPLEARPDRLTLWLDGPAPAAPPEGFAAMEHVADLTTTEGFFANRPLHAWLLTPETSR